jgi:hypothetical protein
MAKQRDGDVDIEFTEAERDMFGDFSEALRRDEHPKLEEYLARCPGSRAKMKPLLEMAVLLDREVSQFRRKYPHVDLRKLAELSRRKEK